MIGSPKTRPPPSPPPEPTGKTQFGEFELLERIAVGGMAEIFLAHMRQPVGEPRAVVIKRMMPSLTSEPDARVMFQEESRLGALVRHPNVVDVLGVGEEAGLPYLVLEYVRGVDLWRLARWLRKESRSLPPYLAVHIVRELLAGLDAVHEARDEHDRPLGIVHRDVSPSNVLLSIHGGIKLGDFGIAHAKLRETYPQAPLGERAKGKLGYLAPEQVRGEPADRRADVFSSAVIAAELLMGRPLFSGGSELAVLLAIRDVKIQPFLEITPTLPQRLGDVLLRALASSPDQRTASAAQLREELAAFDQVDGHQVRSQLAELVASAMSAEGIAAQGVAAGAGATSVTGQASPAGTTGLLTSMQAEGPVTAERPTIDYEIQTVAGERHGPWSYAKVIEAVATGKLGPADQVSLSGGPFRFLEEITDLSRHLPPSTATTNRTQAPREPDETRSLEKGGVVWMLARSILRADTALLLCELGEVRKEVYVKDGSPEFVTSNLASDLLGEYLVRQGAITRAELDMALAVMPRFEGRLGDTIVALGLVEPVHLFQHIAGQVRAKLLDLFTWRHGTGALYRGVLPPPSGFPLAIDAWQLLVEGIAMRVREGMEPPIEDSFRKTVSKPTAPQGDDTPLDRLPEAARLALRHVTSPMPMTQVRHAVARQHPVSDHEFHAYMVVLKHLGRLDW
jgi:hypothetical protein